jgi:hypothetical protein
MGKSFHIQIIPYLWKKPSIYNYLLTLAFGHKKGIIRLSKQALPKVGQPPQPINSEGTPPNSALVSEFP